MCFSFASFVAFVSFVVAPQGCLKPRLPEGPEFRNPNSEFPKAKSATLLWFFPPDDARVRVTGGECGVAVGRPAFAIGLRRDSDINRRQQCDEGSLP